MRQHVAEVWCPLEVKSFVYRTSYIQQLSGLWFEMSLGGCVEVIGGQERCFSSWASKLWAAPKLGSNSIATRISRRAPSILLCALKQEAK